VNGILWKEANTFFGKGENDQIYTVRQDDEGETWISFGDGVRGQRLPSGAEVIANYRFGAEGVMPPAGSINQISKPAKGLQSVKNPLPAFGGADAEPIDNLKTYAPKSALLLGRVVSMKDMEALAAGFPGVRAVMAEWRWDGTNQTAVAQLIYIGDAQISNDLTKAIRKMADPATPISIITAIPKPLRVSLTIEIDPRYVEKEVLTNVREKLLNTKTGMLSAERIGIARPIYRSQLFDAVLSVEGTSSITGVFANGRPFYKFAIVPPALNYFSIEEGKLLLNGKDE
jgi:predicted phage baseplate assembly protein